MLTIFATPKPFERDAAMLQRNAVESWTLLHPAPEVIVLGNEFGVSEICAELSLRHVPEVARNEFGTPLVSDLLAQAQRLAREEIVCYVNSDIILMSDFMEALRSIRAWRGSRPFLAVGTRWNVRIDEPINFSGDWENGLRRAVEKEGEAGGPGTLDYFAFSRGLYGRCPPFAVGRPYWDPWMVYAAWRAEAAVIDITPSATVVHQRHDYGHYPGGVKRLYSGTEGRQNYTLAGRPAISFGLRDATHVITAGGIEPAWRARGLRQWSMQRLRQKVHVLRTFHPALNQLIGKGLRIHHSLRRSSEPIGWIRPAPSSRSSAAQVRRSDSESPGRIKADGQSSDRSAAG